MGNTQPRASASTEDATPAAAGGAAPAAAAQTANKSDADADNYITRLTLERDHVYLKLEQSRCKVVSLQEKCDAALQCGDKVGEY